MAKRGRKKQPLPEQSNKILSYLNRNTTLGVRGIIDELINGMDFRNEAETVVSDIIGNIISDIPETESKSKHSGETVSQDTLESWKNKYPWLTINKVSDNHMRLICDYCSSAKRKLPLTNVWAFEGSPSIQSSSLVRHNASVEHKDAVSHLVKLEPWSKSQNEQSECIVEQSKNTDPIKPEDILVFNTVYYAAKEQEPSEKVNRLLALQKKNGLNTEYQNLSWSTIDNIQESICSVMTKALVDEINSSPSFALMLDESTDITVDKRLSICVRYVKFGVPVTKFLINVPLVDGRAHTIVNSVVQQCIDLGIDLTKMTSLATDGASVMMGHKTGVGVQMKSKHSPFSIQTHCIAHRLNLACTDSIKKEDYLVTFRDKFDSLYHFMSSSPARVYALKQIQQVLEEPELSIKEPHSIRWLGLKTAVEAVYECYASVLSVLSKFAAEKNAVAKGLYKYFCSYKVALVIAFMLDVHSELAILSQQFQRKNLMFSMVQPLIDGTVSKLDVLSNTDGEGLKQMKRDILASDEGKQYKGEKLGFKVTMDDEFNNLRTRYIKSLKHNVKHRLRKDDGDILSDFSKVFEPFTVCNTAEEACNDAITHLSNFYGTGKEITRLEGDLIEGTEETVIPVHAMLDQDKLLDEWPRLIGMIRGAYSNEDPQELCRKLIVLHSDVMPNVSILAAIGLCMQLTSVECERSFSVQNRLKSKFRASIKSEKLQCLIQISMLGPAMESYEPEAAIRHWLSAKKRRKGRLFSPYEPRPAKKQKVC